MLISSIIKRCHNTSNSPLNIIMGPVEQKQFDFFIREILPQNSQVFTFEDTLYGNTDIDIIICNNKILHLEKCGTLSYYFHCPVLVIDHDKKPQFIEKEIIDQSSNSIYTIAINNDISRSWGGNYNLVLGYNIKDNNSIDHWRNMLYQISKIPYNIKEPTIVKQEENENQQ